MNPIALTATVLVVAVGLFIWNRIPAGIVAIGVALSLYFTHVISFEQSLAGFGDPVILYIAGLFVVSEGLDSSGVTGWLGRALTNRIGRNPRMVMTAVLLLVAVVTAFITPNGAVAALVPVVVVLAVRTAMPASRLMIPLAFGAHAGSLLLLTGSPVNVLVSELAVNAGQPPFRFFSFGLVGVPLVIGTVLICVFLGPRLLPRRQALAAPRDLADQAETLARHYSLPDAAATMDANVGLVELVVPPRSALVGEIVFPGMITDSGELVVVAIQRSGDDLGRTTVRAGDVLLVQGDWDALHTQTSQDPGVLVVDPAATVRRQAAPLGARAWRALIVVAGMVVLLATGAVPPAVAALLAACAMLLAGVLTLPEAHRSISLSTLVLVGGMIPLSTAIRTSGAADQIAAWLARTLGGASPYLLLLGVVLVVAVLGQVISNVATVLIVAPIAVAIAAETHISPAPLLMGVAVAGAASFLTPVATPANTMVLGPGGYRFGDYWKLGLPLLVFFILIATFLVPTFWPFSAR